MNKNKDEQVKMKLVGGIEVPKLDLQQYIGKEVKIADVQQFNGAFGFYLKIISTPVDILGAEKKPVTATKIFSLYTDKETGETGWGTKSKLSEYLVLKKVSSPEQLIGKSVKVQVEMKDEKEFLSFV
jgi:hypothetical protein